MVVTFAYNSEVRGWIEDVWEQRAEEFAVTRTHQTQHFTSISVPPFACILSLDLHISS
jgi:hypothetical protein